MKYYAITADYRPLNLHKPKYYFAVPQEVQKRELKKWFENIYSWLKVYAIKETTKEEWKEHHGRSLTYGRK